jgi:hypothetical protein
MLVFAKSWQSVLLNSLSYLIVEYVITNIKLKYSITNKDTYNFNKIGFIIGIILIEAIITSLER